MPSAGSEITRYSSAQPCDIRPVIRMFVRHDRRLLMTSGLRQVSLIPGRLAELFEGACLATVVADLTTDRQCL
jgi:hypothetical protein